MINRWFKNFVAAAVPVAVTAAVAGSAHSAEVPAADAAKVATAATAATAAPAARVSCDARTTLTSLQAAKFQAAFSLSPEACNSLKAVLSRLFNTSKAGGRKLESDRPLDVVAAEDQRQAALTDPNFKAELHPLLAIETDLLRRQVLEAALLHEFGHYLARDLVLRQISTNLGPEK